jgi:hypothetical protein
MACVDFANCSTWAKFVTFVKCAFPLGHCVHLWFAFWVLAQI